MSCCVLGFWRVVLNFGCVVGLALSGAWPAAAMSQGQAEREPSAEARWRALSPERRAELVRRFEELQALPPAERELLVQRAREVQRIERDVLDELSSAQRERLERLAPDARRSVLRELVLDRARDRAERLREALPPERFEAWRGADRDERERMFDDLRRQHERDLPTKVRRIGLEAGLGADEIERLAGLPTEELRRELGHLLRRRVTHWVEENGLPEGVGEGDLERWLAAPPGVFARRYGRLRERLHGFRPPPPPHAGGPPPERRGQRPDFDGPPPNGGRGGPPEGASERRGPGARGPEGRRPEGRDPEGREPQPGDRPGGRPAGPPGGALGDRPLGDRPLDDGPPGGRPGERPVNATGRAWLRRLSGAGAPTIDDRLELAELAPELRPRRMAERQRARFLVALRELGLGDSELTALEAFPPEQLRRAMHELVLERFAEPDPTPASRWPEAPPDRIPVRKR